MGVSDISGIICGFLFEARSGEQVPAPVAVVIGVVGIAALILAALALASMRRSIA
jgi:hypothetical protein